jgi:uncharacterized membrane protein
MTLNTILVTLHVLSTLIWVGAGAAIGWLLRGQADEKLAAKLARDVFSKVANPAFLVAFLAGFAAFFVNLASYRQSHWLHAKVTFGFIAMGVFHMLGAHARRVADGSRPAGNRANVLLPLMLVLAGVAVLLAVGKGAIIP